MDYLDFDLEIGPGTGRNYPLSVRAPAGVNLIIGRRNFLRNHCRPLGEFGSHHRSFDEWGSLSRTQQKRWSGAASTRLSAPDMPR